MISETADFGQRFFANSSGGVTGYSRFLAKTTDDQDKKSVARHVLKRAVTQSSIVLLIITASLAIVEDNRFLERNTVLSAALIAFTFGVRNAVDGVLRELGLFKIQSINRLAESVAVLVGFTVLCSVIPASSKIYVFAATFGYLVYGFLGVERSMVLSGIVRGVGGLERRAITKYGMCAFIGNCASFLLVGSDKLLISAFLSKSELGVYSAHFTAAVLPMTLLQAVIVNVLFPSVSKLTDKKLIAHKIDRLLKVAIISTVFVATLLSYYFVALFGWAYRSDLILVSLFGVYATLFFVVSIKQWLLASISLSSIFFRLLPL